MTDIYGGSVHLRVKFCLLLKSFWLYSMFSTSVLIRIFIMFVELRFRKNMTRTQAEFTPTALNTYHFYLAPHSPGNSGSSGRVLVQYGPEDSLLSPGSSQRSDC